MNIIVTASGWLFFVIVMTPGEWLPVKFGVLVLLVFCGLTYRLHFQVKRDVTIYIVFVTVLYLTILFGWFLGFYRDNPGAIANIGVYFIYPFVWGSFFLANGLEATKKILIKTSFYAGVILSTSLLIVYFFELGLGIESSDFFIFNALGIRVGTQFGGFKLGALFLPYLIFAFALLLEIGIAKTNKIDGSYIISQKKAFAAAALILAALLISGRTVMLICLIWFFFRIFSFFFVSYKRLSGLVFIFTCLTFLIDFNQINLALESKIGITSEPSEIGVRRISQLVEGFQLIVNEPLLGYGVGHHFESVGDWRIEITPVTVLVAHGLFITATLVVSYLFVLHSLIKHYKMHFVTNASILFILASATNPILLKFDFIWIFLLPFIMFGMVRFQSNRNIINASPV